MKKYLLNIILFSIISTILLLTVDLMVSYGLRKTERAHFYTFNKLMQDTLNAEVIILGNSRASCSYNPIFIDSVLNLNSRNIGVSGQPFGISHFRYQLYEQNNLNPKLIILNIDFLELAISNNGFEREQYYPYIWNSKVKPILNNYEFSKIDFFIPLYRYRSDSKLFFLGLAEFFGIYHDKKGYLDKEKGFSNSNKPWDDSVLRQLIISKETIKSNKDTLAIDLLDSFLKEMAYRKIPVLFSYAPYYHKTKEVIEDELEVVDIYTKLAKKYNIPILDYSIDPVISFDTAYFYNATHLNREGAKIFSTKLATDIKKLNIIQNN